MKIAHINIYPKRNTLHTGSGGVAAYSKTLITNIPYTKEDTVYVLCDILDKKDSYIEENVKVIRCFKKNPTYFISLIKEWLKIDVEVIHIQQELKLYGNLLTALLLPLLLLIFRLKSKVVITLHGVVSLKTVDEKFIKGNFVNFPVFIVKTGFFIIYYFLCLVVNKIIVHEDYFANILEKEYFINKNKIDVIPLGIEETEIIPKVTARKSLNLESKKNIILFMGYLTGYKGIDLLIEGFSKLLEIRKDVFLIIGAGKHPKFGNDPIYLEIYNNTVNKAKKMLPNNNYSWKGYIEENEISNYYCAADLTIFPYIVTIASSGPMGISIGYEKPFLCSDSFKEVFNESIIFKKNPTDIANKINISLNENYKKILKYTSQLKDERSIKVIGKNTYTLYKKL